MTDDIENIPSVLEAIAAVERGEPVDLGAVRARLIAAADQQDAMADHAASLGIAEADAPAAFARFTRGLLKAVDVLEEEGPEPARAAFADAFRQLRAAPGGDG